MNTRAAMPWATAAAWTFVAVGAALRITQYVADRSLSVDEAFLALNVIERSPSKLVRALAFTQAAPVGFLEVQKLAITVFGRDELALRLVPLVASLAALAAFQPLARACLAGVAAPIAVFMFALLDPLLYYAATAKQYSLDVAAAVLLLLVVALFLDARPLARRDIMWLLPLGVFVVWFSHPAAFGLAAVGILLAKRSLGTRDWTLVAMVGATVAAWTASFAAQYLLTKANLGRIVGAFNNGGGGAFDVGGAGASWFDSGVHAFRYLVGLEDPASGRHALARLPDPVDRAAVIVVTSLAVVGFVSLARRRPAVAVMVAVPAGLAVLAAKLHHYPLVGRTLLFVLPGIALCFGEGAALPLARSGRRAAALAAAVVVPSLLCIAVLPAHFLADSRRTEEMKEALAYLRRHHQLGDTLYLSKNAQYAFAYYHLCGCGPFDPATAWPFDPIVRVGSPSAFEARSPNLVVEGGSTTAAARALVGRPRVWLLLADASADSSGTLLHNLDDHGRRIASFRSTGPAQIGARLYLYDLASSRSSG